MQPTLSNLGPSICALQVEARLKGAGMHWAPAHVDPMVALRTIACADQWEAAWPASSLKSCARDRRH